MKKGLGKQILIFSIVFILVLAALIIAGFYFNSAEILFLSFLWCSAPFAAIIVKYAILVFSKPKAICLDNIPEQCIKAKITEKKETLAGARRLVGEQYQNYYSYGIIFECDDASRRYFQVSSEQFNQLLEGDEGTLVYKETGGAAYFIRFERAH